MSPKISRRIFVVGCPRSGTTLLQSLLAAHPAIASFPETHAFARMVPRRKLARALGLTPPSCRRELARSFRELGGGRFPLGLGAIFFPVAARRWVGLLDRAALAEGREAWVEKTPRHLHFIAEIRRLVPECRFVHIVRRPEDVVASLHAASREAPAAWGGPRTLDQSIDRWLEDVARTTAHLGSPGHSLVLYERLVADPEGALRELHDELGLAYDGRVLEGYRREAARLVRPEESWKRAAGGPIEPPAARKFEALFDEGERRYVSARAEPGWRLFERRLRELPRASTER